MPTATISTAPLTVRQGESLYGVAFVLRTPAGTPLDLTGCAAHLTARTTPAASGALVELMSPAGLAIDALAGTITPRVDAATTAAWPPDVYAYDLFVTFPDGERVATHRGALTVVAAVTRYP